MFSFLFLLFFAISKITTQKISKFARISGGLFDPNSPNSDG